MTAATRGLAGARVAFRVDASVTLGSGHVARCLVLADRLAARGLRCSFYGRPAPGDGHARIQRAGHDWHALPAADATRLDEAEDAQAMRQALAREPGGGAPGWIVMDHYRLGRPWAQALRAATGARVLVIDGQADRAHDADLLLDPVGLPGQEHRWDGLLGPACRLLLGPAHALLRQDILAARDQPAEEPGMPPSLLVCFGGTDPPGATVRVVRALAPGWPADAPAQLQAVLGEASPHHGALVAAAAGHAHVQALRQPPDLAYRMRRARLAVCAGGGTLLELCALQVPAVVVSIADNQRPLARALHAAGAALDLGPLQALDDDTLRAAVWALWADPGARARQRAAQQRLMPPGLDVAALMAEGPCHAH